MNDQPVGEDDSPAERDGEESPVIDVAELFGERREIGSASPGETSSFCKSDPPADCNRLRCVVE